MHCVVTRQVRALRLTLRRYGATTFITYLSILAGCGGSSPNTGDIGAIKDGAISFPSYAVSPPSEEGWDIEVDREHELVRFVRSDKGLWASIRGTPPTVTMITVYRNYRTLAEKAPSIEVAAQERFDAEVAAMQRSEAQGLYELEETSRDTVTIGGRPLQALYYNNEFPTGMKASGALYLYFPEDFRKSQSLFEFHISKAFHPSSSFMASGSRDLPEIESVIASVRFHQDPDR